MYIYIYGQTSSGELGDHVLKNYCFTNIPVVTGAQRTNHDLLGTIPDFRDPWPTHGETSKKKDRKAVNPELFVGDNFRF